ncbi:MAG: beta-N-acetylhexosaminidase [Sphingomonadaceae bacterium]
MTPAIFGISGATLSADETDFFRDSDPAGYILFARNCENRDQLRALTDELRSIHGRDRLFICIDQEGGRVARMKAPEWTRFPPGEVFDRLYDIAPVSAIEAARANAQALAIELAEVGISADCLPLLDIRQAQGHDVIGDRALGSEPLRVAALGRAILDGLAQAGVVGTIKHIPGHGRALADSHKELPVVTASAEDLETDLAPFKALSDAPVGMTAHIRYTAWDADHPATQSPYVIQQIIREEIGFSGLLMSDDLDMEALEGSVAQRAVAAIAAGCDLALNCWARMPDMIGIAEQTPALSGEGAARLDRALAYANMTGEQDQQALLAKRDDLLALASSAA